MPAELLTQMFHAKHQFRLTEIAMQAALGLFDQRAHAVTGQVAAPAAPGTAAAASAVPGMRMVSQLQPVWVDIARRYLPWGAPTASSAQLSSSPSSLPLPLSVPWVRQAHLLNYGASYYCYLYCRLFASVLWARHFRAAPLAAQAGASIRSGLFQHGGAKDPEEILRSMAGIPQGQQLHEFVMQQLPHFLAQEHSELGAQSSGSSDVLASLKGATNHASKP